MVVMRHPPIFFAEMAMRKNNVFSQGPPHNTGFSNTGSSADATEPSKQTIK
jgi:hypothetical protein